MPDTSSGRPVPHHQSYHKQQHQQHHHPSPVTPRSPPRHPLPSPATRAAPSYEHGRPQQLPPPSAPPPPQPPSSYPHEPIHRNQSPHRHPPPLDPRSILHPPPHSSYPSVHQSHHQQPPPVYQPPPQNTLPPPEALHRRTGSSSIPAPADLHRGQLNGNHPPQPRQESTTPIAPPRDGPMNDPRRQSYPSQPGSAVELHPPQRPHGHAQHLPVQHSAYPPSPAHMHSAEGWHRGSAELSVPLKQEYFDHRVPANGHPPPPPPLGPHSQYYPGYSPFPQPAPYDPYGEPQYSPAAMAAAQDLQAPGRKKVNRANQACDMCRQKKSKCDEGQPSCSACKSQGIPCHYKENVPTKRERDTSEMFKMMEENSSSNQKNFDKLENLLQQVLTVTRQGQSGEPQRLNNLHAHMDQNTASGIQSWPESASESLAQEYYGTEMKDTESWTRPNDDEANNNDDAADQDGDSNSEQRASGLHIPPGHTTAAHKILSSWPRIQDFWKDVPGASEDYVANLESARGILRLYGCGEEGDRIQDVLNDCASESDTASDAASTPAQIWGQGFFADPETEQTTQADAHPSRHLHLDKPTVSRLWESYLRSIHKMLPFLDKEAMGRKIEKFCDSNSPQETKQAPHWPSSNYEDVTKKRKLSTDGRHESGRAARTQYPRPPRNCESALILLILALGRICEHTHDTPTAISSEELKLELAESGSISIGSSPTFVGYSRSPGARNGSYSPQVADSRSSNFRKFKTDASSPGPTERKRLKINNMDRIPGLAYFAYATGILGECHGSSELTYVQACICASLFMGQLLRVMESFRWIVSAGYAWRSLFKRCPSDQPLPLGVRFAFWTCLQLESDLAAELNVDGSPLYRVEQKASERLGMDESEVVESEKDNFMYFQFQIFIRKQLNLVHGKVYAPAFNNINIQKVLNEAEAIASTILAMRNYTGEDAQTSKLHFKDDDPPAKDINNARFQGKFSGAMYVTNRKFLHELLKAEESGAGLRINNREQRENFTKHCQECVNAAYKSCTAFDGLVPNGMNGRIVVTNVFGTAHAQFGNCMVLSSTYSSELHSHLVDREKFSMVLARTIRFSKRLSAASPTMKINTAILRNVQRYHFPAEAFKMDAEMAGEDARAAQRHYEPISASSSFHH